MNKFWRIALAWLLAVALPIQGYAAQTLLLCGPAHHQPRVMDDHAGHAHDHGGMAHAEASANASVADGDKTPPAKPGHGGKCSACSSCCNAAAITSTVLTVAVAPPDLPEVPTVKVAGERLLIGGLERPPRLSRT